MHPRLKQALQVYRTQGLGVMVGRALGVGRKAFGGARHQARQEHRFVASRLFEITSADLEASRAAGPLTGEATSATWFVPSFDHIAYGGIHTVFRFVDDWTRRGVRCRVVIYERPGLDLDRVRAQIVSAFPGLAGVELVSFDPETEDVAALPATDLGVSTYWTSAYLLLRFNQAKAKLSLVQDYEPLFFSAGGTYALAESTYRFGFTALANTPGLLAALESRHGMTGIAFTPAVDADLYHPAPAAPAGRPVRVFFYTRPFETRNAFPLVVSTIRHLLDTHGDGVEVVTAGANWDESKHGLKGRITNLGLLGSREAVADLYRTCDIGAVYMLSKHPSYQPLEFMASGMATVTNRNEDNLWLLRDGENCLLSEPAPSAMAEAVTRLVHDPDLRARIAAEGLDSVETDWQAQLDRVWSFVTTSTSRTA